MTTYSLPEPSGEVLYSDVMNSYGTRGVYKCGNNEFECPPEDVEWAAQFLADALSVLDFHNSTKIDKIANKARAAYHRDTELDNPDTWINMSDEYRDRWRAVVRAVIEDV